MRSVFRWSSVNSAFGLVVIIVFQVCLVSLMLFVPISTERTSFTWTPTSADDSGRFFLERGHPSQLSITFSEPAWPWPSESAEVVSFGTWAIVIDGDNASIEFDDQTVTPVGHLNSCRDYCNLEMFFGDDALVYFNGIRAKLPENFAKGPTAFQIAELAVTEEVNRRAVTVVGETQPFSGDSSIVRSMALYLGTVATVMPLIAMYARRNDLREIGGV